MKPEILCAHDLTESSDPALRTAVDLARRLGAELTVLFASTPPYPAEASLWYSLAPSFEGITARVRAAARVELEARVKACSGDGDAPITLVTEAEVRDPGEAILEAAKTMGPVLVILGTHARTGWQHLLLGSVAERVIRNSPVPVMTVRPGSSFPGASGPLLCATDLTETSQPAVEQALRMAGALHASLTVLYVAPPLFPDRSFRSLAAQEAATLDVTSARLRHRAAAAINDLVQAAKTSSGLVGVVTRTCVVEGLPAERIVARAREERAALIVVGTHGRTGLPHLMLGSVAERVLRTADRPVLTVGPASVVSGWSRATDWDQAAVPTTPPRSLPTRRAGRT